MFWLEKLFQIFYQSLKDFFWENGFSKYYSSFIQILCKLFCKGDISKMVYTVCFTKIMFENKFQIEFILWILKVYFKTLILFCIMQIRPFCHISKVFLKISFMLKTCFLCFCIVVLNFRKHLNLVWIHLEP
jgi:hypothetical protein